MRTRGMETEMMTAAVKIQQISTNGPTMTYDEIEAKVNAVIDGMRKSELNSLCKELGIWSQSKTVATFRSLIQQFAQEVKATVDRCNF